MLHLYQAHLQQQQAPPEPSPEHLPAHLLASFPTVLLLMISDDLEEDPPQRSDLGDSCNVKWINTLIEE